MRTLSFLLCLGLALALPQDEYVKVQFAKFQADFNKVYKTRSEATYRLQVFKDNLEKYNAHNQAGHTYKLGINQFSDLTAEEFKSQNLGGYKKLINPNPNAPIPEYERKAIKDLPESVDWRDQGAVSDVKDQGRCGSCWAFATTEMIESYAAIATGSMTELSAQQVTSCTPNPLSCGGTGGCYGSIPQLGFTYIQLFGHSTEESYPYMSGESQDTEDCLYDVMNTAPVVGITGYNSIGNDLEGIMNHLANVGPLAVSVDATNWSSYSGGVFDGCSYDENISINHAVQCVGYGTDEELGDYWIIRNSWSSAWGEDGYMRLKRESTLECGTDSTPMDGSACVGGPGNDEQHVCGMCGVLFDTSYPIGAHAIEA